jgi:glycosyltransferase involved in cell wall biosynthesis
VDKDLIDVVPNFYDPSFIPGMETHTDNYSDKFTILYVGRLRREKGVDLIIDAAQKLDMSNVSINLVGDGPQRNELEAKAKTANILKSTQFHGYVDQSNLPSYYENADIFVHPGRWPEPFGRTILESLQCDCPPVVSDIGAPPWVVGDAGITFEHNNSADLVKKISKLRGSNDKLERLTRNCQTRLEKFNPDPVITKIEETYTDIS